MRSVAVVVLEKVFKGIEPPTVFVLGLKVGLDLPVRLRSTDRTQRLLDVVVGEIQLEGVVSLPLLISVVGVELGPLIDDYLENLDVIGCIRPHLIEQLDARCSGAWVGLDNAEKLP